MITDVHAHVYPPEVIADWERIAAREPYFSLLVRGRAHRWGTADDLLAAMAEDGVDESWICGFGFADLGLCRLCNDYVLDAAARSGGRLRPLAVVPPAAPGAEAEILRCAARGAIGVGEIFPDGQNFPIDDIRVTWRLAAACQENGLFAMIHAGEPLGRDYPGKGATGPRELWTLARNHPELRILAAHLGGGLFFYEHLKEAARVLQNVWYDTAAAPFLYDAPLFASCAASPRMEKVLYGSDFPLLRLPRYRCMVGDGVFPEEETTAFYGENARLFRSRCDIGAARH